MTDENLTHEDLARGITPDPDDIASILFFHGKESGPFGGKYRALSEEWVVDSPDFQDMDIWERLEFIEDYTFGMENLVVVGSSYGGLLATMLFARHPERFRGYVLAAPALYEAHEDAMEVIDKVPDLARVIHGTHDDIVPIESVRSFCERFGVDMVEVEDGHRLKGHRDLLVETVKELFF